MNQGTRSALLHGAVIAVLAVLFFALPEYHSGNLARIMVLALFAMGYNVLFSGWIFRNPCRVTLQHSVCLQ